ncbi:CocE/NonD family hydrolase [Mesorhizobium sp. M1163]|uniref:CocE/NonD family hydrolase n=1 Tax=Mesorhizobium sp. M1163 TaxID=2957065 RepID=UPI00333B3124
MDTPTSSHDTETVQDGDPSNASGHRITVELDVPAIMRDGVILRANVYRPAGDGPWPTLLARLPYGKDQMGIVSKLDPVQAARRGFMVAIQDTRGRFMSDGEWDPFRFEREDGYDSVEWAAKLPGSNGRIGMYGESYFGNTQWMAAIEQPPSLAAISPALTWADPMDGLFARGGAVELGLAISWTLLHSLDYVRKLEIPAAERKRRAEGLLNDYDSLTEQGYYDLPVDKCDVLRRHDVPDLGSIRALADPSIAERCLVAGSYERVTVPTFHIAGWHDIFLQGTLDNYGAMAGLNREARLIVGPWSHLDFGDLVGDHLFGLRASRFGVPSHPHGDVGDLQLNWLRRHLTPDPKIAPPEKPVRIFVMGRNVWRDEDAWPLSRANMQRWFLRGDGSLTEETPNANEEVTEFLYDPADPVPTVGGQTVMSSAFPAGPMDQTRVEARSDVCLFTSEPLQRELEVTGRVRVFLSAQSSAPSTDWVARLCDVHPNGCSFNLCDGIVRVVQDADGLSRHEIDLWSTSNVFLPGHRLRVAVTSSSFPRWDRNLNTAQQDSSRYEIARQRVFHRSDRPSYIELPIVN